MKPSKPFSSLKADDKKQITNSRVIKFTFVLLEAAHLFEHRLQIHVEPVAVAQQLQEMPGSNRTPGVVHQFTSRREAVREDLKLLTLKQRGEKTPFLISEKSLVKMDCSESMKSYQIFIYSFPKLDYFQSWNAAYALPSTSYTPKTPNIKIPWTHHLQHLEFIEPPPPRPPAPPPCWWRAWRRNHSRREEKTRSWKTGSVDVELQFDPKLGRSSPQKLPGRYETITPSAAVTSGRDPGLKEFRRVWENLDWTQVL